MKSQAYKIQQALSKPLHRADLKASGATRKQIKAAFRAKGQALKRLARKTMEFMREGVSD